MPAPASPGKHCQPEETMNNAPQASQQSEHEAMARNLLSSARVLLDSVKDLLFIVSIPDHRLIWLNAAAQAYFGKVHALPDALGRRLHEIGCETNRIALFQSHIDQAAAKGAFEVRYHTDIDQKQWLLRFEPVMESGLCTAVAVNGRDVSDLLATQDRLATSESMYRSLFESMGEGAVFQAPDGQIIAVNRAAELIEGRTAAQMMGLTSDSSEWHAIKEDGSPFPGDEHPSMVTLRTGAPQANVVMGIMRPSGERRWISINSQPVQRAEQAGPNAVVTTFHDITERRLLETELRGHIKKLDAALEQTLGAMSDMIEMRDPYTAGHERQVARIAVAIGQQLGWSHEQCTTLRFAALVHDIGKIAVPTEILVKPARLTALEYELVKLHAEHGYRILQGIDFAKHIAVIVRQHHERLDGSGYPLGLEADEILMEARVLAVADVVDSMASHRPYRPGLGMDSALAELTKNAGKFYDTAVVDAFERAVASGLQVGHQSSPLTDTALSCAPANPPRNP